MKQAKAPNLHVAVVQSGISDGDGMSTPFVPMRGAHTACGGVSAASFPVRGT